MHIDATISAAAKARNLKQLDALIRAELLELEGLQSEGRRLACRNAIADLSKRRELMAARPVE